MKKIMKAQEPTLSGKLLERIVAVDKANRVRNFPALAVSSKEADQPNLYQDAGGGYNKNFTYPQD